MSLSFRACVFESQLQKLEAQNPKSFSEAQDRTCGEPLAAAYPREPVATQAAADAADDAANRNDHRQQWSVRLGPQLVHSLVEGRLPGDERPAAHVV